MEANLSAKNMTNGYNVKSFKIEIAHYHDKVEDYLSDSEIKALLEVSKNKMQKRN